MASAKKLPSGAWRIRITVGKDAQGNPIRKSFTANTKKEAEYQAAEYLIGHEEETDDSKLTLAAAYSKYIDARRNVLSPSTVREYEHAANRDFAQLMLLKISDITQEQIQRAVNEASLNHSPKTVRNMHGLLSKVLKTYRPQFNLHTMLPQKINPDIFIPTEADVQALISEVKGKWMEKAILLAVAVPCRRSEICALTYNDVDDNGISIDKAMVRGSDGWTIKTTKTTSSKRYVRLSPEVINLLRSNKTKNDSRLVPVTPQVVTNKFYEMTTKLFGHPVKFHSLRHLGASILLAMGMPDLYVQQRGGWQGNETLKRVYAHTLSEEEKKWNDKVFDRMNNFF